MWLKDGDDQHLPADPESKLPAPVRCVQVVKPLDAGRWPWISFQSDVEHIPRVSRKKCN